MENKITPLQYAIFLYEITASSSASELKKITERFLGILSKNNDLGKFSRIIKEFDNYCKQQRGVKNVEIVSANPLPKDVKNKILSLITSRGGLEVKESVDPELIGGLKLIVEDMMIDSSLSRKLRELNKALS